MAVSGGGHYMEQRRQQAVCMKNSAAAGQFVRRGAMLRVIKSGDTAPRTVNLAKQETKSEWQQNRGKAILLSKS